MRLVELESAETRRDPRAALERAIADVPLLEEKHRRAEDRCAKAESERQRLLRIFGALNRELKSVNEKTAATKLRWLDSAIDEAEDIGAHKEYLRLRAKKQELLDQLNYLSNYSQEDNAREVLEASIEERAAAADLLEAQAARQRLAVISGAAAGAQFDPGSAVSFPEDAWSSRAAAEATDIRSIAVAGLQDQLAKHDVAVAKRRELVAPNLFN